MAAVVPDLFTELAPPLSDEEALLEADRCLRCGGAHRAMPSEQGRGRAARANREVPPGAPQEGGHGFPHGSEPKASDVHAPAPCVVACPADVDVPTFVGQIADGDPEAAAATIFAENLLGGTCARVCPVEVLCAGECVLLHEGRDAIEIGRLQRYATDKGHAAGIPLRRPTQGRAGRVAIVGAGPAGLACAGELAARGYTVTVYDEREEIGGLVRFAIAPYRQQREPLPAEAAALAALGVRFELGTAIDSEQVFRELSVHADAVFLGLGMGADADVSYPGDELDGVWESLPFIEALKTGEPPDVGRRVAVIGGGNTAVDVAIESVRLDRKSVV